MNNEKNIFFTVSWLSGLLSGEIFISTGEWGGPDATPDLWKQPFSVVRASGGYPGNVYLEECILFGSDQIIQTFRPRFLHSLETELK